MVFRAGCNSPLAVQSANPVQLNVRGRTGETPVPTVTVWMEEDEKLWDCMIPEFFVFSQRGGGSYSGKERKMFSGLMEQLSKNAGFVGVVLVIAAVIIALARISEVTFLKENVYKVGSTKYVAICGMMGALAGILMLFEIPLVFLAPNFYKLDFSELPVMIGGMYLGPVSAVIIELVKILVHLVLKGTSTAFVGEFANFAVGCSLVLPAVIIDHTKKTRERAFLGLIAGTIVITVFGTLFNAWYLLPAFSKLYGMPLDAIIGMGTAIHPSINGIMSFVIMCVAPLNLIKGAVISLLTLLLYKRLSPLLHNMMS